MLFSLAVRANPSHIKPSNKFVSEISLHTDVLRCIAPLLGSFAVPAIHLKLFFHCCSEGIFGTPSTCPAAPPRQQMITCYEVTSDGNKSALDRARGQPTYQAFHFHFFDCVGRTPNSHTFKAFQIHSSWSTATATIEQEGLFSRLEHLLDQEAIH